MESLLANYVSWVKVGHKRPTRLLHVWPWGDIALDLFLHSSYVKREGSNLVSLDRLIKVVHFIPTHTTDSASDLAHVYFCVR
jgi:hypothetical protein